MNQKGQVLLIVLLIMVVGLTIGLSLATRSVSDIKISSQMENSARAFSAAEGGIEAALKGETPPATPITLGNASYLFTRSSAGGTSGSYIPGKIGMADTYTIWLVGHNLSNGSLDTSVRYLGNSVDVCWGTTGETIIPAMETSVIYQDGSDYKISRGAYDPDTTRPNNFTKIFTASANCLNANFLHGTNISLPTGGGKIPLVLRLRPFYLTSNLETLIGLVTEAGQTLPGQGINIVSTGTAGETTRKVSVIQAYPALPAVFDYVLFSGSGVTK